VCIRESRFSSRIVRRTRDRSGSGLRRLGETWPDQAHIRHRTAFIGIIMPVLPEASEEVGMNTLSVMRTILWHVVPTCQGETTKRPIPASRRAT